MKFEIVTLFPDYFTLSLQQSVIGRAWEKKLVDIDIIYLRDFATDKHRIVDDTPCGGGGGMVLKIEPLDRCLKSLGYSHRSSEQPANDKERIVLTSAAGVPFSQKLSIQYSLLERLTIVCGHYLGVDERVTQLYDLDEVSIGDYVLTGGEPAAAVLVDSVARLLPKVIGNFESALGDSHMTASVGTPCYTRPAEYEGIAVPNELISGDHSVIEEFRKTEAEKKCARNRPDLLEQRELNTDRS